jgi:ferredoxin
MATIKNVKTGKTCKVADGEPIKDACKVLGVEFNCKNGICGTCMIDIIKGESNLTGLTKEEKVLARDKKRRLACQCKIKKGEVEIEI